MPTIQIPDKSSNLVPAEKLKKGDIIKGETTGQILIYLYDEEKFMVCLNLDDGSISHFYRPKSKGIKLKVDWDSSVIYYEERGSN